MRNYTVNVIVVGMLALLTIMATTSVYAQNPETPLPAAVAAARTALVRIHVVSTNYEQGREIKQESFGSGAIISADGYIITNHHVIDDAEHVVCTLTDRREIEAKIIGTDPLADIAVIKLPANPASPYPVTSFGDSSTLKVGQSVYALGCPLAISQSVTQGIISNTEMVMPDSFGTESFKLEGEDVGSIVLWIGHDALIEPGNSGGPLVDDSGNIVGINEISFGLSGAIPSNLASRISAELISKGKIERSWLGLQLQPLLKSGGVQSGVMVSDVSAGTAGATAGIKPGDILLSIGDQQFTAKFKEQIPGINQYIYSLPVGQAVKVKILRDNAEMTIDSKTDSRPAVAEKQHELKSWGICGSNLNYYDQKEMQLESQDGVLITSFLPSGPAGAAKPTLNEGDIVTKVADTPVKDMDGLRNLTKTLTSNGTKSVPVIVEFLREKDHYATVVKLGKSETTEAGQEISKAWLPVESQPLTRELAKAMGIAKKTGVRITRVFPESNASKADLKIGDLILKLDGEQIPAQEMDDVEVFPSIIRQYEIGTKVKLSILRDNKPLDVTVELVAAPKPESDFAKHDDDIFEFQARDIAFTDRSKGKVTKESQGVYVNSVSTGGWAALAQLQTGDVITQINGVSISDLEKLKTTLTEIAKTKPVYVVFRVQRGIHTAYLEVKPEWPE